MIFWRRFCRVAHRDLGYFFFGATIIYAVSGIALNHRDSWNPSYSLQTVEEKFRQGDLPKSLAAEGAVRKVLERFRIDAPYQNHYTPAPGEWRIFFRNGTLTLDMNSGTAVVERLQRRPILHTWNRLHYNPGVWWTWFADVFSAGLIVVAVSGLFLLRGRHGITRRGGVLVASGIVLPGILVFLNL